MDSKDKLIIPVYINEKIVLDMLAILEDGFSKVSQVNYSENANNQTNIQSVVNAGTSTSILSKLLKIDVKGEASHTESNDTNNNVSKEKIHTNTSLLSKFRTYLIEKDILKQDLDLSKICVGDFIEVQGELQKNPLINYLDIFSDVFHLADVFSEKPQIGERSKAKDKKSQDNATVKQIEALEKDLKHSGTIDFIISDIKCSAVLSAQEQYLANDNISELIGGRFKVLGKVISVCANDDEYIDLLRKTTLSIFPENILSQFVDCFKGQEFEQYKFPELVTKIPGPCVMVIPIAIYA